MRLYSQVVYTYRSKYLFFLVWFMYSFNATDQPSWWSVWMKTPKITSLHDSNFQKVEELGSRSALNKLSREFPAASFHFCDEKWVRFQQRDTSPAAALHHVDTSPPFRSLRLWSAPFRDDKNSWLLHVSGPRSFSSESQTERRWRDKCLVSLRSSWGHRKVQHANLLIK